MPVSSGSAQPAQIEHAVDLSALEAVFEKYRGEKGTLIPILQEAQDVYGYLPPQVQLRIAERLGLSVSKVYGVATFYSQFYLERRGRHVLKLCDGTACHVKGAPLVLAAAEEAFAIEPGETTADGELTMEIVYCMGSCALAPVAVIDGVVAGRIRQEWLVQQVKKQISAA